MKKLFSILLLLTFLINSTSIIYATGELTLSSTTKIEGTQNENRYARATDDEKHGGNYSLRLYSTTAGFEFGQNYTVDNLPAGEYTVTWYVKGNDGTMLFSNNWGEGVYNVHLTPTEENGWKKYTKTLTLDGSGNTRFLFYADTAIDCYIDDISLVDANGVNYIIDGGFEEVTVEGGSPGGGDTGDGGNTGGGIDDEKLTLSDTTRIEGTQNENRYARATDDEKHGGNYSLRLYSKAAGFEFGQNYTMANLPAGEYTVTWYVKGNDGKMLFSNNWGEGVYNVQLTPVEENGWKKYTKTLTLDGSGNTRFLFYADTAIDCYIDDISLVDANGVNYIIDGGFEEVTVRSNVNFEGYETFILSCSDFQNLSGSEEGARIVTNIIDSIEATGLQGADAFFCCGDYANTYEETEENLNALKSAVKDFVPDTKNHVYVQGNHDAEIGTQGLALSGDNDPESGEYGVFVINEDDYMWNNSDKTRIIETAENLADYLNTKLDEGFAKPIFVLSHLPLYKSLRTTNDGDAMHANQLFHVLNQAGEQGLNIIFMSGHDHSSGYESYLGGSAVYLAKGDKINIAQGSYTAFNEETLNFTYMNAGYVGYCNSSADSELNMVLFCIDEDTDTVDVYRYDRIGIHDLKSAGVLKSEEEGEYEADTRVYTSPQSIVLTQVEHSFEIETLEPAQDTTIDTGILDEDLTLSATTTIQGLQNENRYAKATDNEKHGGNYSLRLYSTSAGFEFGQNYTMANLPAGEYTVTWYVKGNDGTMLFSNNWGEGVYNVNITPVEDNGWKKYTKTLTLDGSKDTRFLFYADTAIDCYIDDISLVDTNGVNYIIDGGFEEVTIKDDNTGSEEDTTGAHDRYKNDLEFKDITSVKGANGSTGCAVPTDDEFHGEDGYSLYFKAGEKDDVQVTQDFETPLEAGEEYVMTVYAKSISGIVYFRVDWDKTAWMAISSSSSGVADSDGWVMYQQTFTVTGDKKTTQLLINNDTKGGNAEVYIDDISLVKVGEEENLVPDGGFEEVTVIAPDIPPYEVLAPVLKKGTETVDTISGAGTYTVTVAAKNNALEMPLPVELLVAVFDSAGVMLELYSDDADVERTEPRANDTILSVSFEVAEGYSAEVYVINDRQKIDVYHNPVNYKSVVFIPDQE